MERTLPLARRHSNQQADDFGEYADAMRDDGFTQDGLRFVVPVAALTGRTQRVTVKQRAVRRGESVAPALPPRGAARPLGAWVRRGA